MTPAHENAPGPKVLRLPAPWGSLPRLASALSVTVGFLVLAGWGFDVEILKRLRPGFVAMNPMTAVLFVLAGAALGFSLKRNPTDASRWSARIAACVVLAIAGAKLIELGLNWQSNVDQWLFAKKLIGQEGYLPNRIAPNTAVNFILLALSLLLLDRPVKRFSPSQFFALLAGFGALLPITGYAYGVRSFTGLASFIPMALHTAITCLVLAVGLFFAREATPLAQLFATNDSRGVVARRLFPLLILLTLFLGWLRLEGERRGLYEAAFGTALFAVVLCLLFVAMIRWTIWTVGKLEEERNTLNEALHESRWQLEESLLQSRLIVDHAREVICTVDAEGKLLTVNAACDEILALPSRQLLGRSFLDLHSRNEHTQIERAFTTAKSGMTPAPFSAQCRKSDGSYTRLDWSIQWSPHYEKMFCVGRPG